MAKCTVCEARKGKRKCQKNGKMICSLCCGQTRTAEDCQGCSFFKGSSKRNYSKLPYFELREMAAYSDLQDLSELVETTITQIDQQMAMTDALTKELLERLLDKYHFGDEFSADDEPLKQAVELFTKFIADELKYVADDKLTKVLGTIRRSVKRHTDNKRAYLDFIGDFTMI